MTTKTVLEGLPEPRVLLRKAQSLAALDSILSPDSQYRYYFFNANWAEHEMMASMTDGCGDNLYMLFNSHGAIIKGFDHENLMSPWAREDHSLWPGMFEKVPSQFAQFLTEPAFEIPATTFCIWRLFSDSSWQAGVTDFSEGNRGGADELLSIFVGGPESYKEFAGWYYEKEVALELVRHIYDHEPLTEELVRGLNPAISLPDIQSDLGEIGYPGQSIESSDVH